MGRRLYLRADAGRVRVHGVPRRWVLTAHPGVEGDANKETPLVSSGVEQALFARRRTDFALPQRVWSITADAGTQYTSIAFSKELRDAGITGSIGTVGDALDNALMDSTIGVYTTELIDRDRSWSNRAEVERETAA